MQSIFVFSSYINMSFGSKIVFAVFTIAIAEIVWRLGRVMREYYYYPNHYPYTKKFRRILKYGFTISRLSSFLLFLIASVIFSEYRNLTTIFEGVADQVHLLPIWLLLHYVGSTKSILQYTDMIRSQSCLDYATGMAANYFHGYLVFVLPGIRRRIEIYATKHDVQFAVNQLLILIPNSLHSMPVIKSDLMERQDSQPLEVTIKNRAGVSRPYSNDVYRILIDGQPYYIAVEGATPLLSYFDAINFDMTRTWQMKAMQREILLKFYHYLKKILEKWPATQEQSELVFYNDYTADGRPQDVGEVLCTHIKQMWEKEAKRKKTFSNGNIFSQKMYTGVGSSHP